VYSQNLEKGQLLPAKYHVSVRKLSGAGKHDKDESIVMGML
jgi:hypothetical protein